MSRNYAEILPNLFLSDRSTAGDKNILWNLGIESIITVQECEPPENGIENVLHIPILDLADRDLLFYFDQTFEFIQGNLNGEKNVLVHCMHGVSRSATIVIAYLMKSRDLGCEKAIEFVKSKKGNICPNEGFLEQLKVYESINFDLGRSSQELKIYKLKCLKNQISLGEEISENLFQQSNFENPGYKCRKCRKLLFSNSNIISLDNKDSTISVEPLKWFQELKAEFYKAELKLSCPFCSTKIGKAREEAGSFAFRIDAKKVDKSFVKIVNP